jgi:hypothetical protein
VSGCRLRFDPLLPAALAYSDTHPSEFHPAFSEHSTRSQPKPQRAWVALVGPEAAKATVAVCIGATSARACEAAGVARILYPDSPGIEGWVECVREALGQPAAAQR